MDQLDAINLLIELFLQRSAASDQQSSLQQMVPFAENGIALVVMQQPEKWEVVQRSSRGQREINLHRI